MKRRKELFSNTSVNQNVKVLAWFNFFCDFRLYAPIAILYFSEVTNSFAAGMSIFSVTMLAQALFEVPTGIFSDLIGRKWTMIFGAAASTLSVAFYAIGGSYWWLLVGAICEGLGRSFYSGNNDALLMDTLKQEKREHLFAEVNGKISSLFQMALGIAAVLGGTIAALTSYRLVFWLSVIPQGLTWLLAFSIIEPQIMTRDKTNIYAHLKNSLKLFWKNKQLRQMSLISSIGYAVGESGHQFRSAFFVLFWPVWAIGVVSSLANFGATVSFYFSGKVIAKFKELPVLMFGGIYTRIVSLIALLFPSWFSPILMSSTSLLFGVETVAETSLMQKEYTDKERATMGSVTSILGSGLFAISAVMLGWGADKLGTINALLALEIPKILVVWMTWRLLRGNNLKILKRL